MIIIQANTGTQSLIMFALIFLVMYLFMIRPQMKKHKKEKVFRQSLKRGDSIVTAGGICAKIIDVKKDIFIIETHSGTQLKITKNAVIMDDISLKK